MVFSRGIRIAALGAILALVAGAVPGQAVTPGRRARLGVRYLVSEQRADGAIVGLFNPIADTADAILAMVAASRGPAAIDDAVRYLKDSQSEIDEIGERGKVIMALVAAGRSPRSFGNRNLVAEVRLAQQRDGQYGNSSSSGVLDHTLAILGLVSSNASVPRSAVRWLAEAQCPDGGWTYDQPYAPGDDDQCYNDQPDPQDFSTSDTNTTAYAVMALIARPSTVPLRADPFDFFDASRDEHFDGWVYSPSNKCVTKNQPGFCYRTDASSTALVLQAYAAEDKLPPQEGVSALSRLQVAKCGKEAGAFASGYEVVEGEARRTGPNTFATIQAIPGLVGEPFPVSFRRVNKAPPTGDC